MPLRNSPLKKGCFFIKILRLNIDGLIRALHIINQTLFIRSLLILHFLRHAEFISASLQLKEVLKQVHDDKVIFELFITTLYQYFSLKEPKQIYKAIAWLNA